jgi:condensin complex subunit 3
MLKGDRVVEFLTKLLENETSRQIQAVLVTGLAKLTLSGMVTDENVCVDFLILLKPIAKPFSCSFSF